MDFEWHLVVVHISAPMHLVESSAVPIIEGDAYRCLRGIAFNEMCERGNFTHIKSLRIVHSTAVNYNLT